MKLTEESALRIVVYEGSGGEPWDPEDRFETIKALLEQGFAVTRVTRGGAIAAGAPGPVLVLGDPAQGMAARLRDANPSMSVRFEPIHRRSAAELVAMAHQVREATKSFHHGTWKPWFPVIDYDRCTNCMQCLSFCLFDVYGVDEHSRIQVQNNDHCKTNCPACSRVCPEAAIMFPKYRTGPINGDDVKSDDLRREKMKVDISALLGGDVYQMLRDRSARAQSRFSKERSPDKALKERKRCLVQLAESGDIPADVLLALPSPEEIERKAAAAAAKAEAARQGAQTP